jgi:hypothetical protein
MELALCRFEDILESGILGMGDGEGLDDDREFNVFF